MKVEVVRSPRRRKTVELRPIKDGVRISIPAHATKAEEEHYVAQLLRRYQRRQKSSAIDLEQRAQQLASRLGLRTPSSIRWVENQRSRWGSCTPGTGVIRISATVAKFPSWVLDYVIVHELAHLDVFRHTAAFWALVNRYERTERARGYLLAKASDADGSDGEADDDVDIDLTEQDADGYKDEGPKSTLF